MIDFKIRQTCFNFEKAEVPNFRNYKMPEIESRENNQRESENTYTQYTCHCEEILREPASPSTPPDRRVAGRRG